MVLMKNPIVLLLDEPSAGLSPRLAGELISKVKEINQKWGTSVILVEQNIGEALKASNRAVVLVNGEVVVESDEPGELLKGKELENLFLGELI
jgi:branched-chain amino acid transport system ATP-binding protein